AVSTLTAMDIEGIDVAVMYGTRGRQILCHDDLKPDYAAALARAYNNWAADYCKTDPQRLKFASQPPMHDVSSADEGARRDVEARLRAPAVDAAERVFPAAMLHRARCGRGAGGRGRQQDGRGVFRRVERLPAFGRRLSRGDPAVLFAATRGRAAPKDPLGQLR